MSVVGAILTTLSHSDTKGMTSFVQLMNVSISLTNSVIYKANRLGLLMIWMKANNNLLLLFDVMFVVMYVWACDIGAAGRVEMDCTQDLTVPITVVMMTALINE